MYLKFLVIVFFAYTIFSDQLLINWDVVFAQQVNKREHIEMKEKIKQIFNDYRKERNPGAGLYVAVGDEVIIKEGMGLANLEKGLKIDTKTNFRLASVTKQFTATAVLQLINNNKIDFQTNLKEIFPEYPDYGKGITIYHLLTHTSGLIDYEDLIDDTVTIQVKDVDVLKLMLNTDSTYFPIGSQYRYSNTAYALLALTVEKYSGLRFAKYLEQNIFKPLKMDATIAFEDGISVVPNRAYGYTKTDNKYEFTDQSVTSAVLGDGGIYSSIEDLIKWEKSLSEGEILPLELRKKAMTRQKLSDGTEIEYGFGWHLPIYKGFKVVYHTGSTYGFRNIIYRIPEKEIVIIILTNRNAGEEESTKHFSEEIVDILLTVSH